MLSPGHNKHLSIVIPTYNRADLLRLCLQRQIPLLQAHGIALHVIDNASGDDTRRVVEQEMERYPYLHYSRNETTLLPDHNFEIALKSADTEYVWLLGDTYHIPGPLIEFMLNDFIGSGARHDALVFNAGQRVKDIASQTYADRNKLLSDIGWHITCMSALVFHRELLQHADFARYRGTFFGHTGVLLEYIKDRPFSILWKKELSVENIRTTTPKKSSWHHETLAIWMEKWANFVFSLPHTYLAEAKMKCIKDHGKKSNLFSTIGLIQLRSENIINHEARKKHHYLIPMTMESGFLKTYLISFIPVSLAKLLAIFIVQLVKLKTEFRNYP